MRMSSGGEEASLPGDPIGAPRTTSRTFQAGSKHKLLSFRPGRSPASRRSGCSQCGRRSPSSGPPERRGRPRESRRRAAARRGRARGGSTPVPGVIRSGALPSRPTRQTDWGRCGGSRRRRRRRRARRRAHRRSRRRGSAFVNLRHRRRRARGRDGPNNRGVSRPGTTRRRCDPTGRPRLPSPAQRETELQSGQPDSKPGRSGTAERDARAVGRNGRHVAVLEQLGASTKARDLPD